MNFDVSLNHSHIQYVNSSSYDNGNPQNAVHGPLTSDPSPMIQFDTLRNIEILLLTMFPQQMFLQMSLKEMTQQYMVSA